MDARLKAVYDSYTSGAAADEASTGLAVGRWVRVKKTFTTNNELSPIEVLEGKLGEVVEIDDHGDAFIAFEEENASQWVWKEKFRKTISVLSLHEAHNAALFKINTLAMKWAEEETARDELHIQQQEADQKERAKLQHEREQEEQRVFALERAEERVREETLAREKAQKHLEESHKTLGDYERRVGELTAQLKEQEEQRVFALEREEERVREEALAREKAQKHLEELHKTVGDYERRVEELTAQLQERQLQQEMQEPQVHAKVADPANSLSGQLISVPARPASSGGAAAGPAPGELSVGTQVEIHSLLRATELNGVRGEIVNPPPQDPGTGRWNVEIEKGARTVALKSSNLRLVSTQAPSPLGAGKQVMAMQRVDQQMQTAVSEAGREMQARAADPEAKPGPPKKARTDAGQGGRAEDAGQGGGPRGKPWPRQPPDTWREQAVCVCV
jgi:hypothetical protein